MNRLEKIHAIRKSLSNNKPSIGSWIQIPHASVAEIMGQAGYDWVAIDMEHGAISPHQLPDLFRALELGGTLPLVRLSECSSNKCKQALDAGAGGIIVPMIETADQLREIRDASRWPPAGKRGVGFSRANLFGKFFEKYNEEAQKPLLIAMVESARAVENLKEILAVEGLDAILIGPYDLSSSMGLKAEFDSPDFISAMDRINNSCRKANIPCGVHVVSPNIKEIERLIKEGYLFIPYSIDAVFLNIYSLAPKVNEL